MKYLGIDVHSSASVWCLLDQSGEQLERGRTPTTYPALREFASRLGDDDDLLAGHEAGGQVYLVHDAVTAAGVTIQAFNAAHLRMIAASRKKTDKHDATGSPRRCRREDTTPGLHSQRRRSPAPALARPPAHGHARSQELAVPSSAFLRSEGVKVSLGNSQIRQKVDEILEHPDGSSTELLDSLGLCERSIDLFADQVLGRRAVALRDPGHTPQDSGHTPNGA